MDGKRLFRKYMAKYSVIFLTLLGMLIPLLYTANAIAKDAVVAEMKKRLESGIQAVESNFDKLYDASVIIKKDAAYQKLRTAGGGVTSRNYEDLLQIQALIGNMLTMQDFASANYVLFQDTKLLISDSQIAYDFTSYWGMFLEMDHYTRDEFLDKLLSEGTFFMSASDAILYHTRDRGAVNSPQAMLVILNTPYNGLTMDSNSSIFYILEKERLLEALHAAEYLEMGGFIRWQNREGVYLFTEGHETAQAESLIQTYSSERYGFTMTVGIPNTVILQRTNALMKLMLIYCGAGIAAILSLSFFFAYRQYHSIRTILKAAAKGSAEIVGKDEHRYIEDTLLRLSVTKEDYEQRIEQLESLIQNSILDKLFRQGLYTEQEELAFRTYVKEPIDFYCVAKVRLSGDTAEDLNRLYLLLDQYLKRCWSNPVLSVIQPPDLFLGCIRSEG